MGCQLPSWSMVPFFGRLPEHLRLHMLAERTQCASAILATYLVSPPRPYRHSSARASTPGSAWESAEPSRQKLSLNLHGDSCMARLDSQAAASAIPLFDRPLDRIRSSNRSDLAGGTPFY